jgi:hypothetical protein
MRHCEANAQRSSALSCTCVSRDYFDNEWRDQEENSNPVKTKGYECLVSRGDDDVGGRGI